MSNVCECEYHKEKSLLDYIHLQYNSNACDLGTFQEIISDEENSDEKKPTEFN